jgi:hypothetical protein
MPTTTSRLALTQWIGADAVSTIRTGNATNTGILDNTVLVTEGTLVGRPAANTVEKDHIYKATDTGQWFLSDGTNWFPISVGTGFNTPARAYRNTALTVTGNTPIKIPFDAISFDPGGYFDITTNHRYNVPAAGYYQTMAQCATAIGGTAAQMWITLYKNGSIVSLGTTYTGATTGDFWSPVLSDIVQCAASDYLEIYVEQSGGGSEALTLPATHSQENYFSVVRVG